jgi:DNA-binding SARP family transcriptional activator
MNKLETASSKIEKMLAESDDSEEEGDLQTAVAFAQQALAETVQANAFHVLPQAQVQLAKLMARIGRYAEAREFAYRVLEVEKNTLSAVQAWNVLGLCSTETNDIASGEMHFQTAADISRKNADTEGLAAAYHNLSTGVYLPRGQFDLALAIMEEAQRLKSKLGKAHWGLPFLQAYVSIVTGNRKRARSALDEFLPLVKPATRIAGGYFYLWARLALDEEELEKAEEYLGLLMRIASTTGAPNLNIWARLEFSRYYRLKNEAATALTWAEDGLKYSQRTGFEHLIGQAYIEHAQAAWSCGNATLAEKDLQEAETVLIPHEILFDLARIAFLRASWSFQKKDPATEQVFIQSAQMIIQRGYSFILERERDAAFPLVASFLRSRSLPARQAAESLLNGLAHVAPPPLRIYGLGGFSVWQGRHLIPDQHWQRRKAGELFRFLLLQTNHSASREEILEALWPDHPLQAAIDLLHQATSTLRHLLEPDLPDKFPSRYLLVEGERVYLKLPDGSMIDFIDFERQLPAAIQLKRINPLQMALALYQSDLFLLDQYSDWSAARRERLAQQYTRGLLELGQLHLIQEEFFEAVDRSRSILSRDPWNEDAVMLGMKAYLGLRDAPHAISLYKKLEKVLKDELDLFPRLDLRELAQQIRDGRKFYTDLT